MNTFFRVVLALLLLVGVLAGGAAYWLRTSLPQEEGALTVPVFDEDVVITRDQWGIPHIEAQSEVDLYRALGFVHAQDRLWQLDMNRRIAKGRLAEILGAEAVEIDAYMRTLSLSDRAEQAWEKLDPKSRALVSAYNDGINGFLSTHEGALPIEFILLGTEPEPFTGADSMRWMKMMALDLSGNMRSELARLALAAHLTPVQIAQFLPAYPGEEPFIAPDLNELYGDIDLSRLRAPREQAEPSRGSNNWVISGERTESGKPFLANDPHLGLSTPSLWYLAHLKVGDKNVVGVTLPSMPGVVLGRTDRVAWGFTNTGPDIQDLYLERFDDSGKFVATPTGTAPVIEREEIILVKDADPVVITVRETPNGPIMSDVLDDVRDRLPEGYALALKWTALEPVDTTIEVSTFVNDATDFESFVSALQRYVTPQQNMIFADVDGNIGYYAPGKVPIRSPENRVAGRLPVPGWQAEYQWQGFIAYTELPRRFNPESGLIATANEKIVEDDYPYRLSNDWAPPYRGDRIRHLLTNTEKHDLASMQAIQLDEFSSEAADLLPLMLSLVGPIEASELTALANWNFVMDAERPEPLLFASWRRELARAIYADELGAEFDGFWRQRGRFMASVLSPGSESAQWCDDVTTIPAVEDCADRVAVSYQNAMADLQASHDGDWSQWQWGGVHQAVQAHRPFSQVAALRDYFESRSPIGGGSNSVDVARGSWNEDKLHEVAHAASYRAIYDLSNLDDSRYVIPTGQSGNVLSTHYKDMVGLWSRGEYFTIPTDLSQITEPKVLTLSPE